MKILGGGMAGLMAAAMLRNKATCLIEAQPSLPKNHSAVLRFKSSVVGDALNIPFKKVQAFKTVLPWKNEMADIMAYSMKTNGSYTLRSITSAKNELVERYIAPRDFVEQMASSINCSTEFSHKVDKSFFVRHRGENIISTLPMPVMMDLLEWPEAQPEFKSLFGYNLRAKIRDCSMYGSIYIPSPEIGAYRISINGDELIAEISEKGMPENVLREDYLMIIWKLEVATVLGIDMDEMTDVTLSRQNYMKILSIDETTRKRFIMWASDNHGVYSLGRFATWRPGLLLDGIINDIRVIQKIMESSNYEHRSK